MKGLTDNHKYRPLMSLKFKNADKKKYTDSIHALNLDFYARKRSVAGIGP